MEASSWISTSVLIRISHHLPPEKGVRSHPRIGPWKDCEAVGLRRGTRLSLCSTRLEWSFEILSIVTTPWAHMGCE